MEEALQLAKNRHSQTDSSNLTLGLALALQLT